MTKTIKNIIIFVLILAIIGVAYFMFFGKTSKVPATTSNSALQTSTGTTPVNSVVNPTPLSEAEANKISQEFVNQLLNLQAIKLNDDIFSSLAFQSLQDFSIVLVQPGNEGRPNPFAPFGSDELDPNAPATDPSGVIIPGSSSATAWPTVALGNVSIAYNSSWTSAPINYSAPGTTQSSVVGYTFTLTSGAKISWAGAQTNCTSTTHPSFAYGVSIKACVKGRTAELIMPGTTPTISAEDKSAFGDFVQKNK